MKKPSMNIVGRNNDSYKIMYYPRMFAQHPFPSSDINRDPYWTVNGKKILMIESGHQYCSIKQKPVQTGLPFGMLPRLIIMMITTKVKLTGSREVNLSHNISELLDMLGYEASGGETGSIGQLHNQIKRLLDCRISYFQFNDIENVQKGQLKRYMGPIDEMKFWQSTYDEEENRLRNIEVKIHEQFFYEIMDHAFPFKQEDIEKLRPSRFAIDLYLFLCHRVYRLEKDTYISWKRLHEQFGSNYSNYLDFGARARKYLLKIKTEVYPDLNISFLPGRLLIRKSPTLVKRLINN